MSQAQSISRLITRRPYRENEIVALTGNNECVLFLQRRAAHSKFGESGE